MTVSLGRVLPVLLCATLGMFAVAPAAHVAGAQGLPPRHIHILRPPRSGGAAPNTPSTNLEYHGGPVVHAGTVYAIYWLPAGVSTSPNYQPLINRYFTDIGATSLFNIVIQYPDTCCPHNTSAFGAWLDTTTYPRAGTQADPLLDSDIEAEALRAISANPSWRPPGSDTSYFVYTGRNVYSCADATKTVCFPNQYCAYHGSFVSGSSTVLYANMPDAGTTCLALQGPNGDPEADGEIALTSHEHFEIVTDPQPDVNTAWSDASGFEIGDKCAYTFGSIQPDNSNVVLHGHPYVVQQEWSNIIAGCALSYPPPSVGGIAEQAPLAQTDAAAAQTGAAAATGEEPSIRDLLSIAAAGSVALVSVALWLTRRAG